MAKRALPAANRVSSVASGAARAATRLGSAAFNKMFPTLGRILNKVSGSKTDREEYDSKRTRSSLNASFSKNNDTFNAIIDAQSKQNQLLEQILAGLKRSSNPQSASILPGLLGDGDNDGPNIPDLPGLDRPERQQRRTPPTENRQRPTARTRSRWSKFMRFLRRRATALYARIGYKLATMIGLAAVPGLGWLAAVFQVVNTYSDAMTLYGFWQEFNSLPENEQDDDEDEDQNPAPPPPSPEELATAERQQEAARENLGDTSQMGDTQNVTPAEQPVLDAQRQRSEERREQAGLTENLEDPERQRLIETHAQAQRDLSRNNTPINRNRVTNTRTALDNYNRNHPVSETDASRIQQPSAPITVSQPAATTTPPVVAAPPASVAAPQTAASVATPGAPSSAPALASPAATSIPSSPSSAPALTSPAATPIPSTPSSAPALASPAATPSTPAVTAAPALASPAATPSTPAVTAAPGLPEPSATPATKEPVAAPAPSAPAATPVAAEPPTKPAAPSAPATTELPAAKPAAEPPPAPETTPKPAAVPVVTQPITPAAEPAVKAPSAATPVVTPPVTPSAPSGPRETPPEIQTEYETDEEDVPMVELEVSADRETGAQSSRWNVLEKNAGKPSKQAELPESFNAIRLEGNTLIYDFDKIRYEAGLIKFEGEGAASRPAASPVNKPSPAAAPPPASENRTPPAGSSGTDATPISAGPASASTGGGNATGTDTAPISAGPASAPTGGGNATGTDTAPISAGPASAPTGGGNATRVNAPSVTSTGGATPSFSGGDQQAMEMIKRHEGKRNAPYRDSLGLWTVGYGHLIGDGRSLPAEWNRTFSDQEIDALFAQDYAKHKQAAERIPGFEKANDTGKAAIIDLTFNMGPAWFRRFPSASAALARGDFETFANEMQNSLWFRQVGRRGPTIVAMLRAGGSGGAQTAATQTPATPSSGGSVAQASTERVTAGREQTMNSQRMVSNFNQQSTQREQTGKPSQTSVSQNVGEIPLRVRMLSTFNQLAQAS